MSLGSSPLNVSVTKMGCLLTAVIAAKLRSLRSEFGAHLRGLKKPSGTGGGKPNKPWRFFDSLMFLKDVIVPRVNVTNLHFEHTSQSNVTVTETVRTTMYCTHNALLHALTTTDSGTTIK